MDSLVPLKEVNGFEIISLMDDTIDFTSTTQRKEVSKVREWTKNRKGIKWTKKHFSLPFAEHGFSILIKIFSKETPATILFDTGLSAEGVVDNARRMGLELSDVECIVLSHGHYDHFGGLTKVVKTIDRKNLPVIIHDHMFKTRGVINPNGFIRVYPIFPSEKQIAPAKYLRKKHPTLLIDKTILVSGEIPRKTAYEKGFSRHYAFSNGKWRPDPWIRDDRAIIIKVKHKGLAVISGCAHAGIINTTLFAQKITGVPKIYAIMGGFHLAGKDYETRISQTVSMLQQLNPEIIIPMHCTGWRGKFAISNVMPRAFIWNSVGNLYRF